MSQRGGGRSSNIRLTTISADRCREPPRQVPIAADRCRQAPCKTAPNGTQRHSTAPNGSENDFFSVAGPLLLWSSVRTDVRTLVRFTSARRRGEKYSVLSSFPSQASVEDSGFRLLSPISYLLSSSAGRAKRGQESLPHPRPSKNRPKDSLREVKRSQERLQKSSKNGRREK